MAREQIPWPTNTESALPTTGQLTRWGRPLAIATAIVSCISSAFPAVAASVKDTESWPKWWGVLDVGIAILLAMLAFAVLAFAQGKVNKQAEGATYRANRILTHGILVALVVFFLLGNRIVWSNCLTGFAWRAWLLLYSLPAWFTALIARPNSGVEPNQSLQQTGPA